MSSAEKYLDALVKLAVDFGAVVQPGQVVVTSVEPGKEAFARAVATAAYARGAKFVDVSYFDPHVKHARLLDAAGDTLSFVPPWVGGRVLAVGEAHAALIEFYGDTEPDLMQDLDPARLGLDITPRVAESMMVINRRQCNWTMLPAVTPGWATSVYPGRPADQAVDALWAVVAHVCRLNEPDPVAAWEERFDELKRVSATLDGLALDALHFTGPGTDLTVGLLSGARWHCAEMETEWGQIHHANLPSEEVFTTPDPERTQGFVTATRPLLIPGSATVMRLKAHFETGRAVRFEAESGGAVLESMTARDDGAARLGEVALVDRESRVGQTGLVFSNILLDENAASHIALGNGYAMTLADDASKAQMNTNSIHVDFMIGSDEVDVRASPPVGRSTRCCAAVPGRSERAQVPA